MVIHLGATIKRHQQNRINLIDIINHFFNVNNLNNHKLKKIDWIINKNYSFQIWRIRSLITWKQIDLRENTITKETIKQNFNNYLEDYT